MNIEEPLALYLSLWKSLRPSDPVPFPGTAESYTGERGSEWREMGEGSERNMGEVDEGKWAEREGAG
jgi:hypothetical protein